MTDQQINHRGSIGFSARAANALGSVRPAHSSTLNIPGLLVVLAAALGLAGAITCQAASTGDSRFYAAQAAAPPRIIVSPFAGQTTTGEFQISIRVPAGTPNKNLTARLNGQDISQLLRRGSNSGNCNPALKCITSTHVLPSDGLRSGRNALVVSVKDTNGASRFERLNFDWSGELSATTATGSAYPSAVGFEVPVAEKGKPMVRIAGVGLPAATSCTTALQVLVLDRANLTQKFYQCFDDNSLLKSYLSDRTSDELVVVGTTQGSFVPNSPDFDTTPIGGTNYHGTASALYPLGYLAIGSGGAPAGQATENYYVETTTVAPFQYGPFFTGLLTEDQNNNYTFHASDIRTFIVSPNDPDAKTSMVVSFRRSGAI